MSEQHSIDLLKNLIYPSVDSSGNIFFAQSRKIALDSYKSLEINDFSSYLQPNNYNDVNCNFIWKYGLLTGTIASKKDASEIKNEDFFLEELHKQGDPSFYIADIYLKYTLDRVINNEEGHSEYSGISVSLSTLDLQLTFDSYFVDFGDNSPDGTTDLIQLVHDVSSNKYFLFIKYADIDVYSGGYEVAKYSIKVNNKKVIDSYNYYISPYMFTCGGYPVDKTPSHFPYKLPLSDNNSVNGVDSNITTNPNISPGSVNQYIYGVKSFRDPIEFTDTIVLPNALIHTNNYSNVDNVGRHTWKGVTFSTAPEGFTHNGNINSSFSTNIVNYISNLWKIRTVLESSSAINTNKPSTNDMATTEFSDYCNGATIMLDSVGDALSSSTSTSYNSSPEIKLCTGYIDNSDKINSSTLKQTADSFTFYTSYTDINDQTLPYSSCTCFTRISSTGVNITSSYSSIELTPNGIGTNIEVKLAGSTIFKVTGNGLEKGIPIPSSTGTIPIGSLVLIFISSLTSPLNAGDTVTSSNSPYIATFNSSTTASSSGKVAYGSYKLLSCVSEANSVALAIRIS